MTIIGTQFGVNWCIISKTQTYRITICLLILQRTILNNYYVIFDTAIDNVQHGPATQVSDEVVYLSDI